MKLTKEEIEHIANLARLNLEETEIETFREQLSAILDHIAKLQEVNVKGAATGSKPSQPNINSLRQDGTKKSLSTKQLFRTSAASEKDQFLIPPVFE